MTSILRMEGVSKEYSSGTRSFRALDGMSLEIEQGELVVILGPSGSGKTTLLNIVSGLSRPSQGRVLIDGQEITSMSDDEAARFRARNIGLVFQFFNLLPALTALENVEISLALKVKDGKEMRERAMRYLALVGLEGMEDKFPDQLSGGEQQRVSVARALSMEPRLLIADEPTGNLDAETGSTIWKLLRDLNRQTGTTVLAVTHWEEASHIADRTFYLRSGRIEKVVRGGASA